MAALANLYTTPSSNAPLSFKFMVSNANFSFMGNCLKVFGKASLHTDYTYKVPLSELWNIFKTLEITIFSLFEDCCLNTNYSIAFRLEIFYVKKKKLVTESLTQLSIFIFYKNNMAKMN